jgi:hypothetical protein
MPVRLLAAAQGQAANSLYWGPLADEYGLIAANLADNRVELSTDYQPNTRTVPSTLATATVSRTALNYLMNSGTAQTLNLPLTGFFPTGTVVSITQLGTGQTTVVPATGVTVNLGNGITSLITKGQSYTGQLLKVGPNSWNAFGGFSG